MHHEIAARGDLAFTPYLRIPPHWPNARARNATRFCTRFLWSRSIIPTTISGPSDLAHQSRARGDLDPTLLVPSSDPGLCRDRQFSWRRAFVSPMPWMRRLSREAANRGLGYLYAGSAPAQRRAPRWLQARHAFPKADLSIDAFRPQWESLRALAKLEKPWRNNAECDSASPRRCRISIERIGVLDQALDAHGVSLCH